jgi:hypothetical protein
MLMFSTFLPRAKMLSAQCSPMQPHSRIESV